MRGEKLTRKQITDVEWLRKAEREEIIGEYVTAVPKGDYCRFAGRQHKLVDDAARTYDLPLGGPTVNLTFAIKAIHDFIANNSARLRSDLSDDRAELEAEKLRQQIIGLERDNARKEIELSHAKGDAIPKAAIRDAMTSLSAKLRTLGQTLGRISPEALEQLNEFLEGLAVEMDSGEFKF